ncbi:MAG: hypothetical protein AAFX81_00370 [Pseudomonadota bacterium]
MRAGLTAAAILVASHAAAEDFCPALAVPAELAMVCETRIVDGTATTMVRPVGSSLASFNRLIVRRLPEPVDDPAAWLETQMTLDLSPWVGVVEGLAAHPDNPLKPEALEPLLELFRSRVDEVSGFARRACEPPEVRDDDRWTMRCVYDADVAEAVVFLELRQTDGLPIATDFRAAGSQRARQFEALLNGLRVEDR